MNTSTVSLPPPVTTTPLVPPQPSMSIPTLTLVSEEQPAAFLEPATRGYTMETYHLRQVCNASMRHIGPHIHARKVGMVWIDYSPPGSVAPPRKWTATTRQFAIRFREAHVSSPYMILIGLRGRSLWVSRRSWLGHLSARRVASTSSTLASRKTRVSFALRAREVVRRQAEFSHQRLSALQPDRAVMQIVSVPRQVSRHDPHDLHNPDSQNCHNSLAPNLHNFHESNLHDSHDSNYHPTYHSHSHDSHDSNSHNLNSHNPNVHCSHSSHDLTDLTSTEHKFA
jgi:hypothetical protein